MPKKRTGENAKKESGKVDELGSGKKPPVPRHAQKAEPKTQARSAGIGPVDVAKEKTSVLSGRLGSNRKPSAPKKQNERESLRQGICPHRGFQKSRPSIMRKSRRI